MVSFLHLHVCINNLASVVCNLIVFSSLNHLHQHNNALVEIIFYTSLLDTVIIKHVRKTYHYAIAVNLNTLLTAAH